jgi:hypothetical protein
MDEADEPCGPDAPKCERILTVSGSPLPVQKGPIIACAARHPTRSRRQSVVKFEGNEDWSG